MSRSSSGGDRLQHGLRHVVAQGEDEQVGAHRVKIRLTSEQLGEPADGRRDVAAVVAVEQRHRQLLGDAQVLRRKGARFVQSRDGLRPALQLPLGERQLQQDAHMPGLRPVQPLQQPARFLRLPAAQQVRGGGERVVRHGSRFFRMHVPLEVYSNRKSPQARSARRDSAWKGPFRVHAMRPAHR
ncbi:MAG: hypothetical protein WDN72_10515 [Alphaproteobacteria bacterium]